MNRKLAAEVFAQGVPIVVVLPPLEALVAVQSLERLAVAIRRCYRSGTNTMLRAVTEIRGLIAKDAAARKAALGDEWWEPVFDVCFYGIDDWDGRLN